MGANPRRVRTRADLVRELALLRGNAARGTGRPRVALSELARRVGVPRSTVHTYLSGQTLPPAEVLDRIVIALEVDGGELAAWADAWDRVATHEHEARRAPRPDPAAPRQLPPDVPAFTGREECLAALDRWLAERSGSRAVVVSAIGGTAGVGKSALAAHWAHRVVDRFPDGQLHLNLRGYDAHAPLAPAVAAAMLLRALGCADVPPTLQERANRLRTVLADRQVLLVLDNAGSEEQVRHLLPATPTCFTLITSRNSLSGLSVVDGAQRLDLDVLSMAESVELLRRLLGDGVLRERAAAEELVRRCAGLPLALRIAAELARRSSPGEVAARLADERSRLRALDASGDPRSMVRAVFSWSYRKLPEDAARLFLLLGGHPGRDVDVQAAAALLGREPAEAARLLHLLVRVNLVRHNGTRFDQHDLLRDYARELAAAAPEPVVRPAVRRLMDHYTSTTVAAFALAYPANLPAGTDVPPTWLADGDRAREWLTAEVDNLVAVVETAATTGFDRHAVRLAEAAHRHLDTTGRWPAALRVHRAALDAARHLADVPAEATALRNLGITATALGDIGSALAWFRRCVDLRRALGDRRGTASALGSMGIALDFLCRFDDAIAAFEEALALHREHGEPVPVGAQLLNLGVVLEHRGHLDRALANHQQARAAFRAAREPLGEAAALTNLGKTLSRLGEHDEAPALLHEALATYRRLGSRMGEAYAMHGLGVALAGRGDHDAAIQWFTEALDVCAQVSEIELRAEALNGLGVSRCAVGDPAAARDAHTDALAVARQHGNRLEEANALDGLGQVAHATGDSADARCHWERALELYDALRVPGADRVRARLAAVD